MPAPTLASAPSTSEPSSTSAIPSPPANTTFTSVGLAWAVSLGIVAFVGVLLAVVCCWARRRHRRRSERLSALQRESEANIRNQRYMIQSLHNLRDLTVVPSATIIPIARYKGGEEAGSSTAVANDEDPSRPAPKDDAPSTRHPLRMPTLSLPNAPRLDGSRRNLKQSAMAASKSSQSIARSAQKTTSHACRGAAVTARRASASMVKATRTGSNALKQSSETAAIMMRKTSEIAHAKGLCFLAQSSQTAERAAYSIGNGLQNAYLYTLTHSAMAAIWAMQKAEEGMQRAMRALRDVRMPVLKAPKIKWPALPHSWKPHRPAKLVLPLQVASLNDAKTVRKVANVWRQREGYKKANDIMTTHVASHFKRVGQLVTVSDVGAAQRVSTSPAISRVTSKQAKVEDAPSPTAIETDQAACVINALALPSTSKLLLKPIAAANGADAIDSDDDKRETTYLLRSALTELAHGGQEGEAPCLSAELDESFATTVSVPWMTSMGAHTSDHAVPVTPSTQTCPDLGPDSAAATPKSGSASLPSPVSRTIVRGDTTLTISDDMLSKDLPPTPSPLEPEDLTSFLEMGVDSTQNSPSRMITPFSRRQARRRKHRRSRSDAVAAGIHQGELALRKSGSAKSRRPMSALDDNTDSPKGTVDSHST